MKVIPCVIHHPKVHCCFGPYWLSLFGQKYSKIFFWITEKIIHSKKCWVVSTQIWVKCGQTQMLG